MDLLQNFINSKERANRLYRFDAGLNAVLREALGEDWLLGTPEDEERFLSPRQRDWRRLRDFYEVMANSGDLFSYLPMVYARPELFEEIGAVRTLAAAEGLRGFHDACLRLPTQDEQDQFWRDTQEQRKPIENTADTLIDFADLLIRFAERHPGEFREMEARNPFDGMSELLSAMRCQAVRDGRITQESDAAAGLMDHLRKSPPGVDGQTQ